MLSLAEIEAAGGVSIIYADPPWQYSDKGSNGAAENHYRTMKLADICALPVSRLAAKDSVLFLWVTNPLLPEGLELMKAWGFKYKTKAFEWVKSKGAKEFFGMGRWTRGNTESCLIGVRGKLRPVSASVRQLLWGETDGNAIGRPSLHENDAFGTIGAPVGQHSAKPVEVRDRIVELMGDLPRVELFARTRAPGWYVWGSGEAGDNDFSLKE